MIQKLLSLDRRWIFLIIAVVVFVPAILKISVPVSTISNSTQQLYDTIEEFEPGKVVMISLDYGPSSMAELQPQLTALLHHCFAKDLRVIGINWAIFDSVLLGQNEFDRVARLHGKTYGTDYCYLGYKPGGLANLLNMGTDISSVYPKDVYNKSLTDIPMMKAIKNYDHISLVVDLASVGSPPVWINYVYGRFQQTLALGVTGVMISELYPALDAGQIVGILPGLLGAAEYEYLIQDANYTTEGGDGATGMGIQSFLHVALILIIVFCNIAFFIDRRNRSNIA